MRTWNVLQNILFSLTVIALTGCLDSSSGSGSQTSSSVIPPAEFAGAVSAENLGGSIKVSWNAVASGTSIVNFRVYRMFSGRMALQVVLQPNQTEFIDGAIVPGQFYEYIVRAVDGKGLEDANTKKVRAYSYPGLLSATPNVDVKGEVTLTFASANTADKVRIYARPKFGTTSAVKIAELSPSVTTFVVPALSSTEPLGFRTGTTYEVFARAYFNGTNSEDGNNVKLTVQTASDAYTNDSSNSVTSYRYKGFSSVQAFGLSPGAPQPSGDPFALPRTRQVWLRWKDFDGDLQSKYKVVRVRAGEPINMLTTVPCTPTQTSSCIACNNVSNQTSLRMCKDTEVDAPPAKYDYVIGYYKYQHDQFFLEEIPEQNDDIRVRVHIPPDNMVLTQRDAVNYETCAMMGAVSDPKKHNRCVYQGPGDYPLNSGLGRPNLNLDNGYYDFGFNLFVDRYEVGCKWTKSTSSYTACGSTKGCIGMSSPSNTMGNDGDVYLALYPLNSRIAQAPDKRTGGLPWAWNSAGSGSSTNVLGPQYPACYIKANGTWRTHLTNLTTDTSVTPEILSDALVKNMVTIDPREMTIPFNPLGHTTISAPTYPLCSTQVDPNYGAKRLPRLREHRAYAGVITDPEDLATFNVASSSLTLATQNGASHTGTTSFGGYACNTNVMNQRNVPAFPANSTGDTLPVDWDAMLTPGNSIAWNAVALGQVNGDTTNFNNTGKYNTAPHYVAFIGSVGTSHCFSRFGVQDTVGNSQETVSEFMTACQGSAGTPPGYCSGTSSPADPDKGDFANYSWDGSYIYRYGGAGGYDSWPLNNVKTGNYMNVPLGLPVQLKSSLWSFSTLKSSLTTILSSSYITFENTNSTFSKSIWVGGTAKDGGIANRYNTNFTTNASGNDGFRCVLPAE